MVAVYDFPEWSVGDDDDLVPELVVDHIAADRQAAVGGRPLEQRDVVSADQLVHRVPPGPSRDPLRGVLAQQPSVRIGDHRGDGVAERERRRGVVQQAGAQVLDHVEGAACAGCDDGYAARGGLAERVGAGRPRARVHQEVERGDGRGGLARLELAGEPHRVRQARPQPGLLGAVADDDEPGARHAGDLGEAAYAVPLAEAADVADDDLREVAVGPGGAERGVAPVRA